MQIKWLSLKHVGSGRVRETVLSSIQSSAAKIGKAKVDIH